MSRILTARLSALLLFAAAAPAFAFTDVSSKTSYNRAINALQEQGVVEGYSDGSFKASTRINRAEFLKIVLESRGDISDLKNCFPT